MWIAVLSSREVKKGKLLAARRLSEDLVFWRDGDGRVNALRDLCPHRQARLSQGKVVHGNLQCPYHGFEFDGSGRARLVPAMGKASEPPDYLAVKSFPLYEGHGIIWLWYGEGKPDAPPKYFQDMDGFNAHAEYAETWDVSFPRAVENQLDVFHLPFVHYNTIGRGNRTLVNGPVVEQLDETSFVVYPFNQVDTGQRPKRASEVDVAAARNYLSFIYPNLWENYITKNMRILAFFAPVDEERTVIYIYYYPRFTGSSLIDGIAASAGMYFNEYVLHQDRRVVQGQRSSVFGDKLIAADAPILLFRRMLFKDKELTALLKISDSKGGAGWKGEGD